MPKRKIITIRTDPWPGMEKRWARAAKLAGMQLTPWARFILTRAAKESEDEAKARG